MMRLVSVRRNEPLSFYHNFLWVEHWAFALGRMRPACIGPKCLWCGRLACCPYNLNSQARCPHHNKMPAPQEDGKSHNEYTLQHNKPFYPL